MTAMGRLGTLALLAILLAGCAESAQPAPPSERGSSEAAPAATPKRITAAIWGDPPVLVASSRRARRELGWQPEHSKLEQMLSDAWAWRLTHPTGYAKSPRTDGVSSERVAPERAAADGRGDKSAPPSGSSASV